MVSRNARKLSLLQPSASLRADLMVARASTFFEQALNMRLRATEYLISETSNQYAFDNPTCSKSIAAQLDAFERYEWTNSLRKGVWVLLDGCASSSTSKSMANVAQVCSKLDVGGLQNLAVTCCPRARPPQEIRRSEGR